MPVLERVPMGPKKLYGDGAPVISYMQGGPKDPKLWFMEDPYGETRLTRYLEHELLRRGIGERDCPTMPSWMAYVLGGAAIAHLSGKLPVLEGAYSNEDIESMTWSNLWETAQNPQNPCDRLLLGNIFDLLALESHHSPPDKPYIECHLATNWHFGNRPTDTMQASIGNIRIRYLREPTNIPEEARRPEYQRDLDAVCGIIPETLAVAVANIRAHYHY
jgi:hypothetical protein